MRIIAVFFLLSTSFALRAQINAGDPDDNTFHLFEGGVIAGFNMSQVHGDYHGGYNKLGLVGGPVLHINFNRSWFVSTAMLYNQKGARSTPKDYHGYTFKLSFDYVEVPVLINYNDKNRLIFQAGLAYGRLFNIVEEINGNDDGDYEQFFKDEISYVVGGTVLAGEKKHFGINFTYEGSVTSVGVPYDPAAIGLVNNLLSLRGIYYF